MLSFGDRLGITLFVDSLALMKVLLDATFLDLVMRCDVNLGFGARVPRLGKLWKETSR